MQDKRDLDISDIISGCRKQLRSSQNALYRLYYSYGMSICIRYVDNESEAISILNDGFLKVFRNINQFNPDQPFKPWFRKIVVNTAITQIKKNKKFQMEVGIDNAQFVPNTDDVLSQIAYRDLVNMVQSLTASYRAVFNMYVLDGYKHDEIAEHLGITVSTSKSNLARARVKLRELITKKLNYPHV